jgi:hypothetical protein
MTYKETPFLTEDNLSDLLWLVNEYGDKLTEIHDYITEKEVNHLSQTLEAMLNKIA